MSSADRSFITRLVGVVLAVNLTGIQAAWIVLAFVHDGVYTTSLIGVLPWLVGSIVVAMVGFVFGHQLLPGGPAAPPGVTTPPAQEVP